MTGLVVVIAAGNNGDSVFIDFIDKTVFIIDPA
jgi:hypothetical protein